MIDLAIASRIANDQMRAQFGDPPRRPARVVPEPVTEPRAPVRRTAVRVLRVIADRLEPAPSCVEA
jgi:hypothetical protein